MTSYLFFQEQSPELWFGFWNCTGGAALLHTWFVHRSTDVPIAVSAFWHCCVLSGLKSYPETKWLVAWKQATLKGAGWKSENIEPRWNRPFARVGHVVQNRTCCKLHSGTKKHSQVKMDWYELLCVGSPTAQLASQRVWFSIMWPDGLKCLLRMWSEKTCGSFGRSL